MLKIPLPTASKVNIGLPFIQLRGRGVLSSCKHYPLPSTRGLSSGHIVHVPMCKDRTTAGQHPRSSRLCFPAKMKRPDNGESAGKGYDGMCFSNCKQLVDLAQDMVRAQPKEATKFSDPVMQPDIATGYSVTIRDASPAHVRVLRSCGRI